MEGQRLNAENAVAGSILIDQRAFGAVSDMLSPDSFQSELCRLIFQAAQGLSADGQPIDPVAIGKYIRESGGQISNNTIVELMDITPTAANVEYYAGIVLDNAKRRGCVWWRSAFWRMIPHQRMRCCPAWRQMLPPW